MASLWSSLLTWLTTARNQRRFYGAVRHFTPVLVVGKRVLVTRYDQVVEVLRRDQDFTVEQINAEKMSQMRVPFFLGMDRSPQHDREKAWVRSVVRPEDLERIRAFVREKAAQQLEQAFPAGSIELVNDFSRKIALQLVASYFGVAGPDEATMKRWMRTLFHQLFLNLTNDPQVYRQALQSAVELEAYMQQLIAQTKAASADANDTLLTRLLALQKENPAVDDDVIRRNICGLIIGAVDTTSKCVALVIKGLLDRPDVMQEAVAAARQGDVKRVGQFATETLRFDPHNPIIVRYCAKDTTLTGSKARTYRIPAGSTVFAATLSAMFDPSAFADPKTFQATRNSPYLHFGFGLHTCFGTHINGVTIPEMTMALLQLPHLHRAAGPEGRMAFDGPFPNRFTVEFGGRPPATN